MTGHLRIVTRHVPDHHAAHAYNWEAWWSDRTDEHHTGYGGTETEAILDLQRLDRERWEAEHEEEDPPWQDTDAT